MTSAEIKPKIIFQFAKHKPNPKTIQEYFDALETEMGQLKLCRVYGLLYVIRITSGVSFIPIYNIYPDLQTAVKVKKVEIWRGEKMAKYRLANGFGIYVELEEVKEGDGK